MTNWLCDRETYTEGLNKKCSHKNMYMQSSSDISPKPKEIERYTKYLDSKILTGIGILVMICVVLMSGCIGTEEVVKCNKPYILVGNKCCLDKNDNSICDKDEQVTETKETAPEEAICNKPYILVGTDCCLDSNDNGICDKDEGETEGVPNETEGESSEINKSVVVSLKPFDKIEPIPIKPEENTSINITAITVMKPIIEVGITGRCIEKRITTNNADQMRPAIYGDRIVWQDNRNGNWDIYIYDLSTNTGNRITTDSADQMFPAIYGDRIVWEDHRNSKESIYLYDLSTNTETKIWGGSELRCRTPAIYGNKVVYGCYIPWVSDWGSDLSQWNILVYDILTDDMSIVSPDEHNDQVLPAIYEDKIVWLKGGDIYLYHLPLKRITTTHSAANRPAIYGDRIVWQDNRNGNWDIYMYDLSKNRYYRITTNNADQMNPAIYGDRIVWEDNRNGNWDIYQYDLSTNTEKRITTNSASQMYPAIYGDRIVWQDYRNGYWDIYMYSC